MIFTDLNIILIDNNRISTKIKYDLALVSLLCDFHYFSVSCDIRTAQSYAGQSQRTAI